MYIHRIISYNILHTYIFLYIVIDSRFYKYNKGWCDDGRALYLWDVRMCTPQKAKDISLLIGSSRRRASCSFMCWCLAWACPTWLDWRNTATKKRAQIRFPLSNDVDEKLYLKVIKWKMEKDKKNLSISPIKWCRWEFILKMFFGLNLFFLVIICCSK